jgi:hypothetical protein
MTPDGYRSKHQMTYKGSKRKIMIADKMLKGINDYCDKK